MLNRLRTTRIPVSYTHLDEDVADAEGLYVPVSDERSEAVTALMALGYTKNEAASAVNKVKDEGLTCEDYIKQALKSLF